MVGHAVVGRLFYPEACSPEGSVKKDCKLALAEGGPQLRDLEEKEKLSQCLVNKHFVAVDQGA